MTIQLNNDNTWLTRMAEQECYGFVSAGGLYTRMLDEQEEQRKRSQRNSCILGRLIELARRQKGMSISDLSEASRLDSMRVQAIELGQEAEPEPRVLYRLAKALNIPPGGLMELAGLMQSRGKSLSEAAVRFAAKSEPTAKLSGNEREALEEFVKVLAEHSDTGGLRGESVS
ncbi:MAG: helix-turn-helix transcriptional regulator [Phycisphaerales bacterium]